MDGFSWATVIEERERQEHSRCAVPGSGVERLIEQRDRLAGSAEVSEGAGELDPSSKLAIRRKAEGEGSAVGFDCVGLATGGVVRGPELVPGLGVTRVGGYMGHE